MRRRPHPLLLNQLVERCLDPSGSLRQGLQPSGHQQASLLPNPLLRLELIENRFSLKEFGGLLKFPIDLQADGGKLRQNVLNGLGRGQMGIDVVKEDRDLGSPCCNFREGDCCGRRWNGSGLGRRINLFSCETGRNRPPAAQADGHKQDGAAKCDAWFHGRLQSTPPEESVDKLDLLVGVFYNFGAELGHFIFRKLAHRPRDPDFKTP